MTALAWIAACIAAALALAWALRLAGRRLTGDRPYFRDMPLASAFGHVAAAAALAGGIWFFFQPAANAQGNPVASVVFFRWAAQGLVGFAAAACLFRFLGTIAGPEASRKAFRSMPHTAAFGILIIIAYAFIAIFAGQVSIHAVIGVGMAGLLIAAAARRAAPPGVAAAAGVAFLLILALFAAMFFIGPLAPYGQEEVLGQANIIPGGNPETGGNPDFPLGTDQIGRDILSRLIFGARNTVGIAFATTALAFLLGGTFGFLAATLGGWLDQVLSRAVDVLMAIPALIFALLLMTIASVWAPALGIPLTFFMVLIIAVIDSTRVFRLARAVAMNIVVMDYIEAAKLRGEGLGYLIFQEILPNAAAPLLAEFGLRFCFVFLTIASLSFLGVGIQPPLADWGTMVRDLGQFINFASFAPLVATAPLLAAGAIALLTVAVNFVVDWMLHKSSGLKE